MTGGSAGWWHDSGARLLPREFFDRPALEVAPELLGCVLWAGDGAGAVAVVITEVEAYMGAADPASHSYRGRTARNGVMFGPPGYAYVYFTYGMYFCANLVCQPPEVPTAVLLRAGRVVAGPGLAAERRGRPRPRGAGSQPAAGDQPPPAPRRLAERDLARRPGLLCRAMDIDLALDGTDVCTDGSPLRVGTLPGWQPLPAAEIGVGPRVGISQAADWPWRFWVAGDPSVSTYRRAVPRRPRAKPVTGPGPGDGTMHR